MTNATYRETRFIPPASANPHPLLDEDFPPALDAFSTQVLAAAPDAIIDLGRVTEDVTATYDMSSPFALLNHTGYGITILSDIDGSYDDIVVTPEPAYQRPGATLWTGMPSGFWHRIRLTATAAGEAYHVRSCEATMVYQGQLS